MAKMKFNEIPSTIKRYIEKCNYLWYATRLYLQEFPLQYPPRFRVRLSYILLLLSVH